MKSHVLTAASLFISALVFSSALAQTADALPDGMTKAHLASPVPQPIDAVIDGRIWRCSGTDCVAMPTDTADPQSIAHECRRAAKVVGPFDAYRTGANAMDAPALEVCNASLRPQAASLK